MVFFVFEADKMVLLGASRQQVLHDVLSVYINDYGEELIGPKLFQAQAIPELRTFYDLRVFTVLPFSKNVNLCNFFANRSLLGAKAWTANHISLQNYVFHIFIKFYMYAFGLDSKAHFGRNVTLDK